MNLILLIPGVVYHELCNCPEPNLDKWLKVMQCPKSYQQIIQDLSIFPEINLPEIKTETLERFKSNSIVHFAVKDNKVRNTQAKVTNVEHFSLLGREHDI